jgi:hypothetical protein
MACCMASRLSFACFKIGKSVDVSAHRGAFFGDAIFALREE